MWLGLSGGLAAADDSTQVAIATVHHRGGGTSQDSATIGALEADPHDCPQYPQRSMEVHASSGDSSSALPPAGTGTGTWTVAAIFQCMDAPIAVGDVTAVTVLDSSGAPELGTNSQLTAADLASPSDFADTSENAVVSMGGPQTFYYNRPWRGGADLNSPDTVVNNAAIGLQVFEGPPLAVQVSASPSSAAAGTAVTLSTDVSGDPDATLSYRWTIGGGASVTSPGGSTTQATFPQSGTYDATVQVTSSDGGEGIGILPVTVGSTTSQTTSTPTSPTGSQEGGGQNPNGGATTPGGGTGGTPTTGSHASSTPTTGSHTTSAPTTSVPRATIHPQPTSHPGATTSATTPSSSPTGATGAAGTRTTATATTTTPHGAGRPHHGRTARTRPSPTGPSRVVTGLLVSDVAPLPVQASPLVHTVTPAASLATATRVQAPDHAFPWGAIGGGAAVLALLALGARRELGRPWWPRMPRPWVGS